MSDAFMGFFLNYRKSTFFLFLKAELITGWTHDDLMCEAPDSRGIPKYLNRV